MKKQYQLRKGQIEHLVNALKESSYYFGNKKRGGKLQVDQTIVEALQLFLLDSKGKNVRRVINALRNIAPQCFEGVENTDFITQGIRISVFELLNRTLKPKKFKEAVSFLVNRKQPAFYPARAVSSRDRIISLSIPEKEHPQKISEARV